MMSDHGFHAMDEEETKILINFDLVLERLGFLTMTEDGVDLERTQLYSYASPNRSLTKHVRFALAGQDPGGQVPADQRSKIRRKLTRKLARVTYADQGTAFSVRDAGPDELDQGADFVVEVLTQGVQKPLRYSGRNIRGAIRSLTRLSGTHGRKTPGIFIAAGPDLQTKLTPTDLRVVDTTPTSQSSTPSACRWRRTSPAVHEPSSSPRNSAPTMRCRPFRPGANPPTARTAPPKSMRSWWIS